MAIHKSVKEAWQTNARINQSLLAHLTPEMLQARTPGGGLTVAEHLVEIFYNPKYFGLKFAPEKLEPLPDLHEMKGDTFIAESDLSTFRKRHQTLPKVFSRLRILQRIKAVCPTLIWICTSFT